MIKVKEIVRGQVKLFYEHHPIPEGLANKIPFNLDKNQDTYKYLLKPLPSNEVDFIYDFQLLLLSTKSDYKIRLPNHLITEILLQTILDLATAINSQELKQIKQALPEKLFEYAWEMASDDVKRHCHELTEESTNG